VSDDRFDCLLVSRATMRSRGEQLGWTIDPERVFEPASGNLVMSRSL
jgi:hypothetical protein